MAVLVRKEGSKMTGGTKKILKKLVCAGIVTLVLVGCAKATLVDSNSIVRDGIEYYIQTNKSVYNLGENVEILYRITNLADEEWWVRGLAPVQDIVVAAKEGEDFNEIWKWGWYNVPIAGPGVLSLQPNESAEISDIWPQIDWMETWELEDDAQVPPGTYRITGVLDGYRAWPEPPMGIHTSVSVDITIIPEPSSLVLFVVGLAVLNSVNRRRGV